MNAAPYLLTIAETSRLFRRDVSTVHGWIRDEQIPIDVVTIAGRRHIRRVDVERFLGVELTAADLELAAS